MNKNRQQKTVTHCSAVLFPPPSGSSVSCIPPEMQTVVQSLLSLRAPASHRSALYLPRPLKLPSSIGSSNEEEKCTNGEFRSEAVWARVVAEALVGATGVAGWGLRNPVRLSRGTVVTDAAVTSADLTWGFMWFLLEEGDREMKTMKFIKHTHR